MPATEPRQMNWRASVYRLLYLAAIIMALLVGYGMLLHAQDLAYTEAWVSDKLDPYSDRPYLPLPHFLFFQSPAQQFDSKGLRAFRGDLNRGDLAWFAAKWKASSHDKISHGYYVNWLRDDIGLSPYEKDFPAAEQLDPNNASYNYVLAGNYLKDAIDVKYVNKGYIEGSVAHYSVKNRKLLDRAMHEYALGLAKPALRRYHHEIVCGRLALLPPSRSVEDYYIRRTILKYETYPEKYNYLRITEVGLFYGRLLIAEGRKQEALFFLRSWKRLPIQLLNDAGSYHDVALARSIIRRDGKTAAALYDGIGQHELARETRKVAERAAKQFIVVGHREEEGFSHRFIDEGLEQYSSPMANGLIGAACVASHPLTVKTLAPIRRFTQILLEHFWLGILLFFFAIFMALNWMLSALHMRKSAHRQPASGLFLLSPAEDCTDYWCWHLPPACGVLLLLTVY